MASFNDPHAYKGVCYQNLAALQNAVKVDFPVFVNDGGHLATYQFNGVGWAAYNSSFSQYSIYLKYNDGVSTTQSNLTSTVLLPTCTMPAADGYFKELPIQDIAVFSFIFLMFAVGWIAGQRV
jgi:hypothetical protein